MAKLRDHKHLIETEHSGHKITVDETGGPDFLVTISGPVLNVSTTVYNITNLGSWCNRAIDHAIERSLMADKDMASKTLETETGEGKVCTLYEVLPDQTKTQEEK